ncbi:hypothetical protein Raf01_88530 [Rugosimonospora africana]|uniref:Uncharacterized protein n=2 Tax=Rugosimonospora africana TaxID=556532 RepID=A0A8J3VWB9_9ACTN|nr:hypothetical protein Raf01_88530 [Rugosimonospora africana]
MHPVLSEYVRRTGLDEARSRRMINGLRVLQEIAANGHQPITYKVFAEKLQPGLAPLATGAILEDIGVFCNQAGWPNVTCFVVSATTGECSDGFTKVSNESPAAARDAAWFAYAVYKNAPHVDDDA